MRTLLFEDFAGSKKVQESGLLALGYAALLPHLQQQRLKGLNFDTGTMRSGTVDVRLPQADSSTMSDLMRVEEALRLRCRMHSLCSIEV